MAIIIMPNGRIYFTHPIIPPKKLLKASPIYPDCVYIREAATNSIVEQLVSEAAKLGAAQIAEQLGLTSGEISQKQALATYGTWFREAVRRGRLHPSRVGDGRNGKKSYRVVEIQELRTADLVRAELYLRDNHQPQK